MPSRAFGEAEPSDCVRSTIPGADSNRLLDGEDEDLSVADTPGAGGILNRLDGPLGKIVLDDDLNLHLGQEIDDIFGAAIKLGMAFLAAEPLHFSDRDSRDPDFVKRVFHIVQLERFDDGLDLLHGASVPNFPAIIGTAGDKVPPNDTALRRM